MNKILPIILVVVLSGCGGATKTALENCADSEIISKFSMDIYDKDALSMSREEFNKKYDYTRPSPNNYTVSLRIAQRKHEALSYLDAALKIKLTKKTYLKWFQNCEISKKAYPESFDARWK